MQTFRFDWQPVIQYWPTSDLPIFNLEPGDRDHLVLVRRRPGQRSGRARASRCAAELATSPCCCFGERPARAHRLRPHVVQGRLDGQGRGRRRPRRDQVPRPARASSRRSRSSSRSTASRTRRTSRSSPAGIEGRVHAWRSRTWRSASSTCRTSRSGPTCPVPFLGKSVTVGFNFCTRERPFNLLGDVHRRRRLVPDPRRAPTASTCSSSASRRGVPVGRLRRRLGLDLGGDRRLHPPRGREGLADRRTSACAARSTCSGSSRRRSSSTSS